MAFTETRWGCVLACLCYATAGGSALADSPELPVPELEPGWVWELEPQEFGPWWVTAGYSRHIESGILSLNAGIENTVIVLHVRSQSAESRDSERKQYQIHLMTRTGEPPVSRQAIFMPGDDMEALRQVYAVDDHEDLIGVGLAVLNAEGRRKRAAHYAKIAQAAGVTVLPKPALDEPLPFDLRDVNGVAHSSETLHNHVVLFVGWASWCAPCMEKVPQLRDLHESHAHAGLRIIGLNFDREWDDAQAAIDEHGMGWPHVHAAVDEDHQRFWSSITGVTTIPRIIVTDREGVVRADNPEGDLNEIVSSLLQ